jgi:NAD(P)-dependent dehydrogenase (short-subunit alcohol dehydrogenase family)
MSVSELFSIQGKKAVVTGAGRGIGKVLALALGEAGCDVSIIDINLENAIMVAADIEKMGCRALALKADVTRATEIKKAFEDIVREFGRLDICVNNAGVCINEAAEETPEEHYDQIVDTNLKGVFLCCQEAAKTMLPQKSGSIINIASMSGTISNFPQKHAHYNASKAGVILLSKCLAVEWAPYSVRVNTLSPGYTRTELTGASKHLWSQWETLIPIKRLAEPKEFIGAVIYLASDASSYTTGSDIIVDGGYTAR